MNSSARSFVSAWAWCALLFFFLVRVQAQERQVLPQRVASPEGASLIASLPGSQQLHLAVALPLRNEDQLNALLQQVYDPASSDYRRFLTVSQFTEQFGPTVVDYQRVIGYLQSYGLKVTHTFANRLAVDVTGPVANIEQAFQVTMRVYQHPTENRTFYAPDGEPSVELGFPVLSVEGLSTYSLPHSMMKPVLPNQRAHSNQAGSGPGGLFTGSDFRTAYGGGTALDGSGQALGLIELGSYNLSEVVTYFKNIGQPLKVPITNVLLGGADGICSLCNDGEEALDIEQEISIAPNASALMVYEAYTPSVTAYDAYLQVANDNLVKSVSLSFGWGGVPSGNTDYETVFKEMAAQGQSSFVASGDAGANCGSGGYPGNSPNITDTGGTVLTTNGAGGAWQSETGWSGSGGGWNTQSPIPSGSANFLWNQEPAINSTNGGSANYRNIPDVAAEASDDYFCGYNSCGGTGGTSAAAPKWAGFVALINQQAAANATAAGSNPTLGLLNPAIYDTSVDADFHDITTGSNYNSSSPAGCTATEFSAGTGYDLVTGWGTPNGPTLINALAPTAAGNPNFSMSATPDTLSLTPGAGGTSSIAVTAVNGLSATANLTVTIPGSSGSNAPPGLGASLSASSIPAGGSPVTLTVSTTSSTPGGTYLVAITGTSGGLTQTAYVTVALPWFELVPSLAPGLASTSEGTVPVAGVSINQGGTVTDTIAVEPFNGFSGTVNLALSGTPPSGVTWSFSPATATTTTTSTLTETASNTLALTGANSPTTVLGATITGTSAGVPPQSTTVNLNLFVNPPATGGSGTAVDLSASYNLSAFYTDADETAITTGLDGVGYAYSANLLNSGLDLDGVQFTFGPANQSNAVYGTGTPITLPAGTFANLQLLATGIEGNQASQTVTVTYTDNSTSTFMQSFSDWCSHLNGGGCTSTGGNSGESVAVAMPYRDSAGGADNRVFYLYHYSLALNTGKTVQSVTLPNNRNVVVLAATLTTAPPSYSLSAPSMTTPVSVNAGASSTAAVTLTPANGYTGSVTLSCSISPVVTGSAAPTCSFGPNPVSVTSGAATATLTFSTVAPPGRAALHRVAGARHQPASEASPRGSLLYGSLIVVPSLALVGIGFSSKDSRRKKLVGLSIFWMMSASLLLLPACGGGSSNSGGGGSGCSSVPSVPTGLAASSTTSSDTTLTWTASTASSGCSVTGYTVYQNGTSIATTTSPTYNVTGLSASTQYNFSVAATDSDGASAQSTAISVTTLSNGTASGTYTITITGKDANGVVQTGGAAAVTVVVN